MLRLDFNLSNKVLGHTNSVSGHTICADCTECIDCGACTCGRSRFQIEHLVHAIMNTGTQSRLYKAMKKRIKQDDHWKNKSRNYKK